MEEKRKLKTLKLWYEDPTPIKGGAGNILLGYMGDGGLKGEFQVDIVRKGATKVLGKDVDLTSNEIIPVNKLPEDIRNELIAIFYKIEKLL